MTGTEKRSSAGADAASDRRSALAGVAPDEVGQKVATAPDGVKQILPAGAYMTSDHRYYFNGEGPVPSVTTILEVMSKPALVTWKAQEAARAMYQELKLADADYFREVSEEEAVKWALQQTDSRRDKAAGIGTSVHLLADLVSRSEASERIVGAFQMSEQEKPYVDAFRGFLAFLEAQGGRIISSEHVVWSLNGYAGTYDLICELPGSCRDDDGHDGEQCDCPAELWLIDIKTSKSYYPEYGLQLAGYRWADSIILPGDPRPYPMPEIHRTGILHLRPEQYLEGWRLIEYPTTYWNDYLTFLGALEVWKWRKEGRFSKQNLLPVLNTVTVSGS